MTAIQWLADVMARPEVANNYKVFRVDNEDIKGMLGLKNNEKRFSWNELFPDPESPGKFQKQYEQAIGTKEKDRDAYQSKVVELYRHATHLHAPGPGSRLPAAF